MKKIIPPSHLISFRKEAKTLFKSLPHNSDLRFRLAKVYPFLADQRHIRHPFQLKHIYHLMALEYGFNNWSEMKEYIIEQDMLYKKSGVAVIHSWFPSYSLALAYFKKNGGYLLKFWDDYVVCGPEYIKLLNLHTYAQQWQLIGYNWVEPAHLEAYHTLYNTARELYLKRN